MTSQAQVSELAESAVPQPAGASKRTQRLCALLSVLAMLLSALLLVTAVALSGCASSALAPVNPAVGEHVDATPQQAQAIDTPAERPAMRVPARRG